MSLPVLPVLPVQPLFFRPHFQHVHLNSVDPEQAIAFYTTHFASERAAFRGSRADAGIPAMWAQKS